MEPDQLSLLETEKLVMENCNICRRMEKTENGKSRCLVTQ